MSKVETFFRRCPSCGRRFEIQLVSKKLVESERIKEEMPINNYASEWPETFLPVGEDEPAVVDVEEFQYAYKCKHCGHEWAEKREETVREKTDS
jgi:DNA-directed RNA polymerase subunit RPC12/RpoP